MGPYCKFCNSRCFAHFPQETPQHILDAYGTSTIVATCPAGQEFEKKKVGYCYDDIIKAIQEIRDAKPCEFCGKPIRAHLDKFGGYTACIEQIGATTALHEALDDYDF